MSKLSKITPYNFEKIGITTFVINFNGDIFLTLENSNETYVDKITKLLNGAFREGVIFGQFNPNFFGVNKIENL